MSGMNGECARDDGKARNVPSSREDESTSRVCGASGTPSRLRFLMDSLALLLKALLPRRRHEPTGPFVLIFDMLLSIFVPRGARRSVIDRLPVHVIGAAGMTCGDTPSKVCSDVRITHAADCSNAPAATDLTRHVCLAIPVSTTDKCAICLGPYEIGETVRQLRCDHVFHSDVCTSTFFLLSIRESSHFCLTDYPPSRISF